MVVTVRPDICDGHLLKWMLAAGVNWLEQHKSQVNNMNVFPVPDGDTGTNMVLTIRRAYQQIAQEDISHVGEFSKKVARGALTGARGNSGTILSMLLRGFAQSLEDKEVMDAHAFSAAVQNAVDFAYKTVQSVMEPVEGTILTVARKSAETVKERAKHESDLRVLLEDMLSAARDALENTPNQLPKLKEAGVVDSGGMGLVYILEGMNRLLEGKPVSYPDADDAPIMEETPAIEQNGSQDWQDALTPEDEEGYGYDVQFLMHGDNLDVDKIRRDISEMGWSPLIDGDSDMIKVHIHVHNPGEPLSYAIQNSVGIDDVVVENMQSQYLQYVQERQQREKLEEKDIEGIGVITVVRGDGLQKLFEEYGAAHIIEGGQTMNPSTEDFLSAIEKINTDEIIILPNNGNIIMAARQAADMAPHSKTVRVIPSKSIQQGLNALISFADYADAPIDDAEAAMREGMSHVVSAEVTSATRDATIDGTEVKEGQLIGFLNGKLVSAGDNIDDLVNDIFAKADLKDHELATIFYGEAIEEDDAQSLVESLEDAYDMIEFEVVYGGQPLYPYLISIE